VTQRGATYSERSTGSQSRSDRLADNTGSATMAGDMAAETPDRDRTDEVSYG
jgi:hypothetical protein